MLDRSIEAADVTSPDIGNAPLFQAVKARMEEWYRPGSGAPVDLVDLNVAPDGKTIAASAVMVEKMEGLPTQRICLIDYETGALEFLTNCERNDRGPKFAPDGTKLLFVGDRDAPYDFQAQILDLATGEETPIRVADHWCEYASWSPDGTRILIAVAGRGVDLSGAQGGIPSPLAKERDAPDWAPSIEADNDESEWRSLWVYNLADASLERVSPHGITVWEACWCGDNAVLFVGSDSPKEEDWYSADLRKLDLASGEVATIYTPKDQLGWPSASPSGERFAIVEAVCSDRTIVAGQLLVGGNGGPVREVDTARVDVTSTAWQSESELLYAGHRSYESVLALHDVAAGSSRELWADENLTFGSNRYPEAIPGPKVGQAAMMIEGHFKRPELFLLSGHEMRSLLALGDAEICQRVEQIGSARNESWTSSDGLEIHGWLLKPPSDGPFATVLDVHGGPVWAWRPRFVGRPSYAAMLLEMGYAVFQPNVRGASGRGQEFARHVFGDMGGADTDDFLTGLDHLVARGVADPARIGVTGGSYGGFMSSWLITQDNRFAAAVPIAPVTHWASEHLTCHIGHFCEMFLDDDMTNPGGKYFTRSPIFFAKNVETPCLHIAGALDRNTPPGQAMEFHHALKTHGKESVLLTYPGEGHGIRKMPATIDFTARLLSWFISHMPAR